MVGSMTTVKAHAGEASAESKPQPPTRSNFAQHARNRSRSYSSEVLRLAEADQVGIARGIMVNEVFGVYVPCTLLSQRLPCLLMPALNRMIKLRNHFTWILYGGAAAGCGVLGVHGHSDLPAQCHERPRPLLRRLSHCTGNVDSPCHDPPFIYFLTDNNSWSNIRVDSTDAWRVALSAGWCVACPHVTD
eukprot:scaffold68692_cov35-Prasinocladus_malaysianus.AAC.2